MEITASLVKELRERTGAGMMECKKALTENSGDIDVSAEWLRKQGLAKADKKSGRIAAEGRIKIRIEGELPSPLNPPGGCAFHKRCPFADARCKEEAPELRAVGATQVACHHAEQINS